MVERPSPKLLLFLLLVQLLLPSLLSAHTLLSSNHTILIDAQNYSIWIGYSNQSSNLTVYISIPGTPKPAEPLLNVPLGRRRVLASDNPSVSSNICDPLAEGNQSCGLWQKLGLLILVLIIIIPVVALAIYVQQNKAKDDGLLSESLRKLPGMPREFRYHELAKATGNFDDSNKLGQGGFGVVYRGSLPTEETELAVKTFSRATNQGDFLAELTIINRLRHRHLVRLLGWCYKNKRLLLVYEFMPNGSLDKHLYNQAGQTILPWERRYNVLVGVASALHYLHNEYHQKVVHRDLKASNIMLDSSFNACLGDFGLARAIDDEQTSYEEIEGIPGTWGYIAPECFHTGKATGKSDVYGFGAVVLETVCGRRPGAQVGGFRQLVEWVWALYEHGLVLEAVDPRLDGDYVEEEANRLLLLGLACMHPNSAERPKTQVIVQIVSGSIPPPAVPLEKPPFIMSPHRRESARFDGLNSYSSMNGLITRDYFSCEPPNNSLNSTEMSTLRSWKKKSDEVP